MNNEQFEDLADLFYRDTGYVAPGKEPQLFGVISEEDRQAKWDEWIVSQNKIKA